MNETHSLILIVDDNPLNLQVLGAVLESTGFELAFLTQGAIVLSWAREHEPTVILLDIMMPDMDGIEVCRALKNDPTTKDIPVIFVTARTETDEVVKGFDAGAVDYVTKPFNVPELMARVKTHAELRNARLELERYVAKLSEANEKLALLVRHTEELAITDELTGISNRRYFLQRMLDEATRSKRTERPFCVAIIDIDFFKRVNDEWGHECGDYTLREVTDAIKASIREQDFVARWGGEEFTLLLPETTAPGAEVIAERIRTRIAETLFTYGSNISFLLTVTIGVAQYNEAAGIDGSIKRADDALYAGKRLGRNRVVSN
jgi:diguanylate cyclase (GGDEF)-like protein